MSNWKYTDATNAVVYRVNEDGSSESCLVEVIADWIAVGNVPDAADPIPIPPITVTPWRMLRALNQSGLREVVEAAVASADQDTKDGWAKATEFVENDPLVISLCAAIGKTDADRHALFQLASTL